MNVVIPREDWQADAECSGVPVQMFYPEEFDAGERRYFRRAARRVCASCSVQAQCLEYALRTDERFGIFGGLTPRERDQLAPRRRDA